MCTRKLRHFNRLFASCLLALFYGHFAFADEVIKLSQNDFTYGTYIIDKPGYYKLIENIEFNPNSVSSLQHAIETGILAGHELTRSGLNNPVDAFSSGMPLPGQLALGEREPFTPGGPVSPRYDPAAFGVGFFAAIAITTSNVVLDLGGYTIAQSAEHALLQRFFSVIELAGQPFIPGQGPADFGERIQAASNVTIRNGTIGRSAHHGIHGNANQNISIINVDFEDYEVGAVALNGVDGLVVRNATATNRKAVPVLGTFSAAQFIKPYLAHLVRIGSSVQLQTNDGVVSAPGAYASLRQAVNNVYHDVITRASQFGTSGTIDRWEHPEEYALFHNPQGVVDGNAYSFLLNRIGVAVNGFPYQGETAARNIVFRNVHVRDQQGFINEVVALTSVGGGAMTDPVGAVWQLFNRHPDTNELLTISSADLSAARYTGNLLADAQALVAKAIRQGEFDGSHLDVSRSSISSRALDWVESAQGLETLDSIVRAPDDVRCNGDSMFHVNKGVIGFKIDAAQRVRMINTSVHGLVNRGRTGSALCGDYADTISHPQATLPGYGGARVRGYSIAGSTNVRLIGAVTKDLMAVSGDVIGIDIMTDSSQVQLFRVNTQQFSAGLGGLDAYEGANPLPMAAGIAVGPLVERVKIAGHCSRDLMGYAGATALQAPAANVKQFRACPG